MGIQQSRFSAFCSRRINYMEQYNNYTVVSYGYGREYFERELFDKIKNGYCTRCGHVDKCVAFEKDTYVKRIDNLTTEG